MSDETNSNNHEARSVQPKQGIWRTYDGTDGLPPGASCVLQDRRGYLWVGTRNGLCRYDGVRFVTYTTKDGLPANSVRSICEDSQGRLWFGTFGGGVCCFHGSSFTTYTTADGLLDNRVFNMLQDREGNLWFIHFHSGLTRFDTETTRSLTGATVSETLIQTSEGALWFGDGNQLCCLYKGEQRCQTFDSMVVSLMEDSSGRFWVGTLADGLYCYDSTNAVWEGKRKHFTEEEGLKSNVIYSVIEARDGTIWVGTAGSPGCLCRFNSTRFEAIQTPHPVVQRLLEDNCGRIWMGGWAGGGLHTTPRVKVMPRLCTIIR